MFATPRIWISLMDAKREVSPEAIVVLLTNRYWPLPIHEKLASRTPQEGRVKQFTLLPPLYVVLSPTQIWALSSLVCPSSTLFHMVPPLTSRDTSKSIFHTGSLSPELVWAHVAVVPSTALAAPQFPG